MKKMFYAFALVAIFACMSCGNKATKSEDAAVDSAAVEAVDSVEPTVEQADTVVADTVVAE